jgi:fluoride ion exporter CrcB/FEX
MRKYIYIGAGGAAGAILRYLIYEMEIGQHSGSIPATTLFINTFGCFFAGVYNHSSFGNTGA